jgi:3-hydroxymyristoyl/3-hydroxydecanoyl-(acyl carrier protein) dehydratase
LDPSTPFRVVDERTDGDSAVFTVVVPEDCPYFDGHFPERRILPAIGQLAIVEGLVRRVSGSSATLAGVDGFRLSRQVSPGDLVEVRVAASRDGQTAAFEILCEGARVSRGKLRVAARSGG